MLLHCLLLFNIPFIRTDKVVLYIRAKTVKKIKDDSGEWGYVLLMHQTVFQGDSNVGKKFILNFKGHISRPNARHAQG
jgi:hypothetical protein